MSRIKIGDWIKADIIGLGFYEVVSTNDFHVSVKCLKIFGGKNSDYRGHVTNCHHGIDKETGNRIPINQESWLTRKVKRLSEKR